MLQLWYVTLFVTNIIVSSPFGVHYIVRKYSEAVYS